MKNSKTLILWLLAFIILTLGAITIYYALGNKTSHGPKKYFITFGNQAFVKSRARIAKEAKKTGVFDEIIVYDESFVKKLPLAVQQFIAENPRGYGYWVWNSFVVQDTLEKMQEGDMLFYADAGCKIYPKNKKSLIHYFELISANSQYDMLAFSTNRLEKGYTKMDTAAHLNATDSEFMDTDQYHATFFLIRKTKNSSELVNKWMETSQNFHMINDAPSLLPNAPEFTDHRHDQSIWSLIRKKAQDTVLVLSHEKEVNKADSVIIDKRIRG